MGKAPLPLNKRNCYPPYPDHYLILEYPPAFHIEDPPLSEPFVNKYFTLSLVCAKHFKCWLYYHGNIVGDKFLLDFGPKFQH